MRAKTISLAVVASLAMAAPANAGVVVVTADPVQKAISIADAYWGGAACGGNYHVVYTSSAPIVDGGPANAALAAGTARIQAWAQFGDPTCTIHLMSFYWTPATETSQFQLFCDVVTHEIGHFLGHLDAGQADPKSINYPIVDESSPNYGAVPGCVTGTHSRGWGPAPNERAIEAEELKEIAQRHKHAKHTHKRKKVS
jgi:hypothetical protein